MTHITSAYRFTDPNEKLLVFKKLTVHHITRLILNKEVEAVCELIDSFPALTIMPMAVNMFHISGLLEANNPAYINQCIESKVELAPNMENVSVLHFLLNSVTKDPARINTLLKHSEKVFKTALDADYILNNFTSIFFKILSIDTVNVASFLKICVAPVRAEIASQIPSFGTVESFTKKVYITYDTPLPREEMLKPVIDKINPEGTSQIQAKYFRIPLNFNPNSKHLLQLMRVLLLLDCDEIFRTSAIRMLIDYGWRNSRNFIIVNSIIYSVSMILFSVNLGLKERHLPFEIVNFVIAVMMLFYEFIQFSATPKIYIREIWNVIDVLAVNLRIASYILVWSGVDQSVFAWFVAFAFLFGYLRWISYLRIFKSMSKKIQKNVNLMYCLFIGRIVRMLVQIFLDLRSFFVVLLFLLIGFTLIFYLDSADPFNVILLNTYALMFGQVKNYGYSTAQMVFLIITTVFLSTVLINMIISMMNDTFATVQMRKDFFDNKEKVSLIFECISIKRIFDRILFRKRFREMNRASPKYLFAFEEKLEDDFESTQQILESSIESLKEQMNSGVAAQKELEAQYTKLEGRINSQVLKMKNDESKMIEALGGMFNTLNQKLETVNAKLEQSIERGNKTGSFPKHGKENLKK